MTVEQDRNRFISAFKRLALIFPTKTTAQEEQDRMNVYWNALKVFTVEQVEGGMAHIANTQRESYFPTPGRIVDTIKEQFPDRNRREPVVVDNTPPNERGAAYFLYCIKTGQLWDWDEYEIFKRDWAAGLVKVDRHDDLGKTRVKWERSNA